MAKPSALVDTRVIYCGDNLEQLEKLPDACVDLIYIDPPFNSNRNYEVFWGETKEKRSFEDRHESTQAYIEFMRPRCVRTGPRAQEDRQLLLSLRLARLPLREGHARPDFRREQLSSTRSSGSGSPRTVTRSKAASTSGASTTRSSFIRRRQTTTLRTTSIDPYDPELRRTVLYARRSDDGRRYQLGDLDAPGGGAPSKGNPHYEFLGVTRYWRYSEENMEQALSSEGRIVQTKPGRAAATSATSTRCKGVPLGKRLGRHRPLIKHRRRRSARLPHAEAAALLERIIEVSSQRERHRPRRLLRLRHRAGRRAESQPPVDRHRYLPHGLPRHGEAPARCLQAARRRKALAASGAASSSAICRGPRRSSARCRRSSSRTGRSSPSAASPTKPRSATWASTAESIPSSLDADRQAQGAGELDFMDDWYPIQVKQKDKVGRPDIDMFEAAMMREDRKKGFFVSLRLLQRRPAPKSTASSAASTRSSSPSPSAKSSTNRSREAGPEREDSQSRSYEITSIEDSLG